jgi:hypothetical protein
MGILWGTIDMSTLRKLPEKALPHPVFDVDGFQRSTNSDESQWTFGQWFAVFLLGLPVLMAFEVYHGRPKCMHLLTESELIVTFTDSTHESKEEARPDPLQSHPKLDSKPPPPYRTRSNFLEELSEAALPNHESRQNLIVEQATWTNLHYHNQFDLYWYKGYMILVMFLELEVGVWLITMGSHWRYPGTLPVRNWLLPPMVIGTTALYPSVFVCIEIFGPTLKSWMFSSARMNARKLRRMYVVFIAVMIFGDIVLIHFFANMLIGYHNVVAQRVSNS